MKGSKISGLSAHIFQVYALCFFELFLDERQPRADFEMLSAIATNLLRSVIRHFYGLLEEPSK